MSSHSIRFGCAGGYLEGRLQPGLDLARYGECDYLGLEALNEASLSVLQRDLEEDSSAGYHAKGVEKVAAVAVEAARDTHIVSSIGGANPRAGAERLARELHQRGEDRSVACVSGDNLTDRLDDLVESELLTNRAGRPLGNDDLDGVFAASAYLGAMPIAKALESAADIVVTGRVVDSALYLGPAMYEFGWASDELDRLAAASVAGHLLECAGHIAGGNYWGPGWQEVDYVNIGHGVADLASDGTLHISKLDRASGLITRHTVSQQLLYEIGDPSAYVLPDVTVDVASSQLFEVDEGCVRVEGVRGRPAPDSLRVLLSRRSGYIAEGFATFTWPDARLKAERAADALSRRLVDVHGVHEFTIDLLGAGALTPVPSQDPAFSAPEVTLRVAAAAASREQASVVHDELANFYDCAPAGACGISGPTSGSRAGARERIEIVPCLVPSDAVNPTIEVV